MTAAWLGLALYAEGPTDHRFLDRLLPRAVSHLLTGARYMVEVSEVQRLPVDRSPPARAERIATGAQRLQSAFHILFVHADGGADPAAARSNNVAPGLQRVREHLGDAGRRGVAVVPVRELETWVLADGASLASVLGTTRTATELGVPTTAGELEGLLDPKAVFAAAVRAARPGRRHRRRPDPTSFLEPLGAQARIAELRRLPAFAALLKDLQVALGELGFSAAADA